jgi:ferredoxin
LSKKLTSTCFVRFDKDLCAGRGTCLPVCPTKAIRIKNKKAIRIVEQCIGCGECIRVCRELAVSAVTEKSGKAPWPLISPVCPMVVRLIAFKFLSLLPNVLPVLRPVALMAREVRRRVVPDYLAKGRKVVLCYMNPCPTQKDPSCLPARNRPSPAEVSLGIIDIYPELIKHVNTVKTADDVPFYQTRFEYETCATGNASMWGMSGGETADMGIDRSLAVSGMEETIQNLEKIEMRLVQDIEYKDILKNAGSRPGGKI